MTSRTVIEHARQIAVAAGMIVCCVAGCDSSRGVDQAGGPHREVNPSDTSRLEDSGDDARDAARPDTSARPDSGADTSDEDIAAYALSATPYTTLQGLWAPRPLSDTTRRAMGSEIGVTEIDRYANYDIGVQFEEGQPWVIHDELAPGFRQNSGAERSSLLYFWEAADPQMIDEESPIRFAGTTIAPMGSTYRPQSHLIAQVFESQVRSARRISEVSGRPFDFAFIAGDMTDGGQENELGWTIDILAGGVIDPDSGVDDDPVSGPGNDFSDPFRSPGIGVPWYPAVGNHETLYMGTFPATDAIQQAAIGDRVIDFTDELPLLRHIDTASNGFRDGSTPFADVVTSGTTPPDSRRRILDLGQVLSALQAGGGEPVGHGIDDNNVFEELGYYSFYPLAGKPIRFLVINTLLRNLPTALGGISRAQFNWVEDELKSAQRNGELVIVGSHHRASDFGPVSVVSGGEFKSLLASYDNVVLHVAGHGHHNAKVLVRPSGPHEPEQGYWEIMCSSTVDFPMQSRIIEVVYEGDGYLSVYVTNLEQNAAEGTMARQALDLAVGRKFFVNRSYRDMWQEGRDTMNLLLRFKLTPQVADSIEAQEWPARVESEATLQQLTVP